MDLTLHGEWGGKYNHIIVFLQTKHTFHSARNFPYICAPNPHRRLVNNGTPPHP